jgi:hypothetical protein
MYLKRKLLRQTYKKNVTLQKKIHRKYEKNNHPDRISGMYPKEYPEDLG